MRLAPQLPYASLQLALVLLFGLAPLAQGCLPGERANDPLPDVAADAAKPDAGKTDAKTDVKADGVAGDATATDAEEDAETDPDAATDVATLGCKTDGDCAQLPTLPCFATPTCDAGTGLCASAQLAVDAPCATDLCFLGQKCDATGACLGGTPKCAADTNACTLDLCSNGVCSHPFALDTGCDDGDACTTGDHCVAGACSGTPFGAFCNDNNPCTHDKCNSAGDSSSSILNICQNVGFAYDASAPVACTGAALGYLGFCDKGVCGVQADCADTNDCTYDSFNAITGACDHLFISGVCGSDKCNPGTCQLVAGTDGVQLPTCVTTAACTTTKVCMTVKCDPATGKCGSPTPLAKGTACGDLCLANGTCDGGAKPVCSGTPLVCNDGNICTDDSCISSVGCTTTPTTAPGPVKCNDGNGCTVNDVCTGGLCAGTALQCDDGNACTIDASCDAVNGCLHTLAPDGTDCGNNSACSQGICVAK